MSDMTGQHAIVFGGESGIGKAATASLAQRGVSVLIAGINSEAGHATEAEMRNQGFKATYFPVDVRERKTIEAAVAAAKESSGKLEILVYSSGVYDAYASTLETTEELWDQVMEINLKGCFRACQVALPTMIAQNYGRIIAVASIASYIGTADGVAYTTSKSGMLGMVRHIGCMHASQGITMNAVCPGIIETELRANSAKVLGEAAPSMSKGIGSTPDAYKSYVPAKRRGQIGEVGELIAFLADPCAGYMTGGSVLIDGGWVAA